MQTYQGPIFDADSHLVELGDAWTRYLPKKYVAEYGVTRRTGADGQFALYMGDRKVEVGAGYYTEDGKGPPPGSLKEFLKALKEGKDNVDLRVPVTPDQTNREERLKKLDEFGVESCILFVGEHVSTIGYIADVADKNVDAAHQIIHAYNEWMHQEWGFVNGGRMFGTPLLHLYDMDKAVAETEWAIKCGARIVLMPLGPVNGKAPGDPCFDPIWARLNEAGVRVSYHISEATFMHPMMKVWGEEIMQSRLKQSAWTYTNAYGRVPIVQTLSSLIFYNFFERFPNIKVVSAENGAEWVPQMLIDMDKARGMAKNSPWPCGQLKKRPSQIFRESISVVAYPEDNLQELVRQTGSSDWLLMGSDFPHAEGVPTPRDFVKEACEGLTPQQVADVMYHNGRRFLPAV